MIPIGLGVSQWINRAMAEALKRMRLKPKAFPNRLSQPGGGGTMGLQEGSPHVPTQPLAPPVAEPELPQLSLQAPPIQQQQQQEQLPDWRTYFNEYVRLLRRQPIPFPQLQPPLAPTQTDWQRTLPALIGMLFAPGGFREGFLQGLMTRYQQEQEAQGQYDEAMRDFANQQAQLAYQQAQQEALADQQAQDQALKLALSTMSDEQKRELQRQIEVLRNATRLDIERMQNDMQAVSRHMAIANNPSLPAEQRAAAYQNAAAILSRYGYELPALPAAPSVSERAQQLREQVEPAKLELQKERFDFEKWRGQQQVQQGWQRIDEMRKRTGIAAAKLGQAAQSRDDKLRSQAFTQARLLLGQLDKHERALMSALNARTTDEYGRPIPKYNITLQRQQELLSGAPPTNAQEAQWQDLALRLGETRRMKEGLLAQLGLSALAQPGQQQPKQQQPKQQQPGTLRLNGATIEITR
jgi:gas vesicle protein